MKQLKADENDNSSKQIKYVFSHYNTEVLEQLQELQEISFPSPHELVQHCNDFLEYYLKQPRWLRCHSTIRVKCSECVYSWTLNSSNITTMNSNELKTEYKIGNCFGLVHQHRKIETSTSSNNSIKSEESISGKRTYEQLSNDQVSIDQFNEISPLSTNSRKKIIIINEFFVFLYKKSNEIHFLFEFLLIEFIYRMIYLFVHSIIQYNSNKQ